MCDAETRKRVHPLSTQARPVSGVIDVGAYEFGAVVVADAGAATDAGVSSTVDAGVIAQGSDAGVTSGSDGGVNPGTNPVGCGCSADGGSVALAALLVLRKWGRGRSSTLS